MRISFVSILGLLCVGHGFSAWIDVNSKLAGKVIHIESLRYRGNWLDAHDSKWGKLTGCAAREVYFKDWTQFAVRDCGGGKVCMESMRYKHHYVDAHHNGGIGITHSNYPDNQAWAQWTVQCENGNLGKCRFLSARYNNFIDANHSKWAKTAGYGYWSNFRILAPNPSQSYVSLLETTNESNLNQKKTLKFYVGVVKKTTVTTKISTTLSFEIQYAFLKAGGSMTAEWTREQSTTFSTSREVTYIINIPAGTTINFKQLTGAYGPFSVKSRKFRIECKMVKTGGSCLANPDYAEVA